MRAGIILTLAGLLLVSPHASGQTAGAPSPRLITLREAVDMALQRNHVAPARMEASGRSSLDSVATNATPEGRAENRRVELLLPRRQEVTGTESTTP